ncbi:hypothetical protein [Streptomyces sp. Wb2n-11]|uniref:hypothetical protein n=1 Tax=Streptomyces sp. Wb2n-11 TaxID=1030533 RepID=UPI000A5E930B|nr:hypothetical protein [Streptomyces sp. Wb2n-11]
MNTFDDGPGQVRQRPEGVSDTMVRALGPLSKALETTERPRAVRRDAERPSLTAQRFEALPYPWEAAHRPSDAVDVLAPEVAWVVAEPKCLPQMDEARRVGPLPEPLADDGFRPLASLRDRAEPRARSTRLPRRSTKVLSGSKSASTQRRYATRGG